MDKLDNRSDWDLIESCKKGDDLAWKELAKRHERSIRLSIRKKLGAKARDIQLVEDLAQDLFFSLLDPEYQRLGRYNPKRGCFHTFLNAIAAQVVEHWRDHEARRPEAKSLRAGQERCEPGGSGLVQAEFAEYLDELTPQEARCLREKMLRTQEPFSEAPIKPGNERLLRHRLKEKWKDHFDER